MTEQERTFVVFKWSDREKVQYETPKIEEAESYRDKQMLPYDYCILPKDIYLRFLEEGK